MNDIYKPYLEKIESHIKASLSENITPEWKKDTFDQLFECVTNEHLFPLVKPTVSLINAGGKRWRPLFLVLTCQAFLEGKKVLDEAQKEEILNTAYSLTPLVEFVHTASLIHDDIEDQSESRRGMDAAYITYGLDTAINAGSWLYFEAPVCINKIKASLELKELLYRTYTLETRRLHLGQAMDIAWHRQKDSCPSTEEYLAMVKCKTGTLASLASKIGAIASGADENTVKKAGIAAAEIGAGFQIIDDVINLTTGNPGKKRGDDIVEGKKSLPVLLYIQKNGKNSKAVQELNECFIMASKEGIDSLYVEKAISLLEKQNVIIQAKENGLQYIKRGLEQYRLLTGDTLAMDLIEKLFNSMVPSNL